MQNSMQIIKEVIVWIILPKIKGLTDKFACFKNATDCTITEIPPNEIIAQIKGSFKSPLVLAIITQPLVHSISPATNAVAFFVSLNKRLNKNSKGNSNFVSCKTWLNTKKNATKTPTVKQAVKQEKAHS